MLAGEARDKATKRSIDQFRYIEIQPKTIDLSTRLWGMDPTNSFYSPEPRAEVCCFRLNFNISKLVPSFLNTCCSITLSKARVKKKTSTSNVINFKFIYSLRGALLSKVSSICSFSTLSCYFHMNEFFSSCVYS